VNLKPDAVLREFPEDWKTRASTKVYGKLALEVLSPLDLLVPKLKRGEPRDHAQAAWAKQVGLLS
jgi:hypothetical protein